MFEVISRRFQLKFKNRSAAGNVLADILKDRLKKQKLEQCIVLGVPRGGIVTADAVARKLSSSFSSVVEFDFIMPRKLTDPDNKEQSIGAIMEDGTVYLDEELIGMLQITPDYLEREKAEQIGQIKRRNALYSINSSINHHEHLKDKATILVDDGAATGSTLIAAARWLRRKHDPRHLIIAIPVAPKNTVKLLRQESDIVEVVTSPSTFRSVEQFYLDFKQVPDDKVVEILKNRNNRT